MVKIYGRYALVAKEKSTFHRHLVCCFYITNYDGKSWWMAYYFVWKLYDHFAPIHWKRIQNGVAQLASRESKSVVSFTYSENNSELPDLQ